MVVSAGLFGTLSDYSSGCRIALAPFYPSLIREGSLEDVKTASESRDQVLVDARQVQSCVFGSVERA